MYERSYFKYTKGGCLYNLGTDSDWEWGIKRCKIKQTEIEYSSLVDDSIL